MSADVIAFPILSKQPAPEVDPEVLSAWRYMSKCTREYHNQPCARTLAKLDRAKVMYMATVRK